MSRCSTFWKMGQSSRNVLSLRAKCLAMGTIAVLAMLASITTSAARTVRIMPLGDSLTSSIDGQASYRYWLWQRLMNAGYNVEFVGSQSGVGDGSGIYPNFNQNHEGHSGATTDAILGGIHDWAAQSQPDVVLLLIGANDLEEGQTVGHALSNTRQIIHELRAVNPRVAILWAMLPPIPGQTSKERVFNGALVQLASRWTLPQSPIRIVNLWSNFFPALDTVDGQHPDSSGEHKYSGRFYTALVATLYRFGQYPGH